MVDSHGDCVLSADGLVRSYGAHEVLRGVDLRVYEGQIVALLGPNGAGKTTTLELLEGHQTPDAGEVSVFGLRPDLRNHAHCANIGILLQDTGFDPFLRLGEALKQRARFYPDPLDETDCLDLVGLGSCVKRFPTTLSGGELRRFDLALALVGQPRMLFLDEPTTGFDPRARQQTWELLERLKREGITMLLTTHYLEEAEALADWAYVLQGGKISHSAAPDELNADGQVTVRVRWDRPVDADLLDMAAVSTDGWVLIRTNDVSSTIGQLLRWTEGAEAEILSLEAHPDSLVERYLAVVADS
ncbi:MAG TPA: ABC transporter ATP-binding protein [Candidatus Limnocylindria bacterium]